MDDPYAAKDALVTSLLVERYAANDWWTRRPSRDYGSTSSMWDDSELACARRRRDLIASTSGLERSDEHSASSTA